jgi:hypothetical protein
VDSLLEQPGFIWKKIYVRYGGSFDPSPNRLSASNHFQYPSSPNIQTKSTPFSVLVPLSCISHDCPRNVVKDTSWANWAGCQFLHFEEQFSLMDLSAYSEIIFVICTADVAIVVLNPQLVHQTFAFSYTYDCYVPYSGCFLWKISAY